MAEFVVPKVAVERAVALIRNHVVHHGTHTKFVPLGLEELWLKSLVAELAGSSDTSLAHIQAEVAVLAMLKEHLAELQYHTELCLHPGNDHWQLQAYPPFPEAAYQLNIVERRRARQIVTEMISNLAKAASKSTWVSTELECWYIRDPELVVVRAVELLKKVGYQAETKGLGMRVGLRIKLSAPFPDCLEDQRQVNLKNNVWLVSYNSQQEQELEQARVLLAQAFPNHVLKHLYMAGPDKSILKIVVSEGVVVFLDRESMPDWVQDHLTESHQAFVLHNGELVQPTSFGDDQ